MSTLKLLGAGIAIAVFGTLFPAPVGGSMIILGGGITAISATVAIFRLAG